MVTIVYHYLILSQLILPQFYWGLLAVQYKKRRSRIYSRLVQEKFISSLKVNAESSAYWPNRYSEPFIVTPDTWGSFLRAVLRSSNTRMKSQIWDDSYITHSPICPPLKKPFCVWLVVFCRIFFSLFAIHVVANLKSIQRSVIWCQFFIKCFCFPSFGRHVIN